MPVNTVTNWFGNVVSHPQVIADANPPVSDDSRYTFSPFAFPVALYAAALTGFFAFSKDCDKQKHYRSNLLMSATTSRRISRQCSPTASMDPS